MLFTAELNYDDTSPFFGWGDHSLLILNVVFAIFGVFSVVWFSMQLPLIQSCTLDSTEKSLRLVRHKLVLPWFQFRLEMSALESSSLLLPTTLVLDPLHNCHLGSLPSLMLKSVAQILCLYHPIYSLLLLEHILRQVSEKKCREGNFL